MSAAQQVGAPASRLKFSLFDHSKDNQPKESEAEWSTLVATLKEPEYRTVKDGLLISPATFNGTRSKANVTAVHFAVLDIDDKTAEQMAELMAKAARYDSLAHTTWSQAEVSSQNLWRLRLFVRLSRAVPSAEWPDVWALLQRDFGSSGDKQCKDASRMYYTPSLPVGFEWSWRCWEHSGPAWDVDAALAAGPVGALVAAPSASTPANTNAFDFSGADTAELVRRDIPRCPPNVAAIDHAVTVCQVAPIAVEKQKGQNALLALATDLVIGLRLDTDTACALALEHYNPRCLPPWREDERAQFARKFAQASENKLYRQPGYLLESPPGAESETELGHERRSDLGNARRLVRRSGNDLRFFTAWRRWLIWDGTRWAPDERGLINLHAKAAAESLWDEAKQEPDDEKRKQKFAWAAQSQNLARIKNMIALAESEPGIPVVAGELDSDPYKFNVVNGTIDLKTGALLSHDQADLITKLAPVRYVPGARSALWESLLQTWTNGDSDLAAYIQRAIGYALFGEWREKAFWFAYGNPDGGKSTFLNAISSIFGDYYEGADASTWLVQTNTGGNRGDLTRLLGRRFVVTAEFKKGSKFDVAVMKRTTGGDAITAAAKYKDEITFVATFALWLAANDRPIASDDDEAFMGRIRCVPFTASIPPDRQNTGLGEELRKPEHLSAILAWAVHGCLEWQKHGLGTCKAVDTASSLYRAAMNPVADFLEECIELKSDGVASTEAVSARYRRWCQDNNERALAGKQLGKRLRDFGATGGDDASKAGNKGQRTWRGIALKDGNALTGGIY